MDSKKDFKRQAETSRLFFFISKYNHSAYSKYAKTQFTQHIIIRITPEKRTGADNDKTKKENSGNTRGKYDPCNKPAKYSRSV